MNDIRSSSKKFSMAYLDRSMDEMQAKVRRYSWRVSKVADCVRTSLNEDRVYIVSTSQLQSVLITRPLDRWGTDA